MRQSLPTGTDVELFVSADRRASDRAPEQQEAAVGLTLTQALLRGSRRSVNLVRLKQARLDVAASVYELRAFAEAVLAEAETAYWRLALAEREVAILDRAVEVAGRQRDDVRRQIDAGALAPADAAAPDAEIALREQALIDAQAEREAARVRLLSLVRPAAGRGDDPATLPEVRAVTDAPADATPVTDLADRLAAAVRRRPDLNEARLRLEQDRLETELTRDGLRPRLDFFATLRKTGFDDTFDGAFADLDGETYDLTAGLRLSRSLTNRGPEARDRAARLTRQRSARAVANLERLVRRDVRLAATEVERLRRQLAAAAASRAALDRVAEAERQRVAAGAATALVATLAERDALRAELEEAQTRVRYRLAVIELHRATGTLLEHRGVGF